ncbi:MAG: hypothetical protein ACLFPQ_02080 [Candidatus Woesearchaeota archaeon]
MKKKRFDKAKAQKNSRDELENRILELELEISKINREKSAMVLNKAMYMYFVFLVVAVMSVLNGYTSFFNLLVFMGLCVLIIGAFPYIKTMHTEDQKLNLLVSKLKSQVKN